MESFIIRGIAPPGRVHFRKHGLVELFSISESFAEKLWKDRCPYVQLSDQGRQKYLNQTPIELHVIPGKKSQNI